VRPSLYGAELLRVPGAVEVNEADDPAGVGALRPRAPMTNPGDRSDLLHEGRRRHACPVGWVETSLAGDWWLRITRCSTTLAGGSSR
jgi:hypothetical protein